jgi:redox-sensitive bicupin YhaK (pirin superfamily)
MPPGYSERAVYVVAGAVDVGGETVREGFMAVLRREAEVDIAATVPSIVMLLGGEPVGHRFIEWNFVSSSRERIEMA